MNIAKQHLEFKIRGNKIDSNHVIDLKPYQIDSFLDNAALFICNHWGELTRFQGTQFSKDLFGTLLVKWPDQPEMLPSRSDVGQYEYDLSKLKYDYFHLDSVYIKCGNTIIPITIDENNNKHKLNDSYQKPSFKWKRLSGTLAKSLGGETSLYVNSDVSLDDDSKKLRIEYVKYPKKVFFGNYDSIEYIDCRKRFVNPSLSDCSQYYKSTDDPVDSELPKAYHDLQVDIAVWLATGKTENQLLNNFISQKISALPQ